MGLTRIDVRNLRILREVTLMPGDGLNLVVGANGAGKTSILEGIYFLGRGRSFRSAQLKTFLREGTECVEVTGWRSGPGKCVAGIRRCAKGTELRIDGQAVNRISAFARAFPLQLVTPRSHELLERGPDVRRRFVDWGVFHVEQSYLSSAANYQRVLRQRNAALKSGPRTASVWEEQLVHYGGEVDTARQRYIPALERSCRKVAEALGLPQDVVFTFSRGWAQENSLAQALESKRTVDREQGYTTVGPHRADLRLSVSGARADARLSRGQQKLLVLSLILAQMTIIGEMTGATPILLVDDAAAELDENARNRVMGFLRETAGQTFVTSVDEELLGLSQEDRLFHVEQGKLSD